MGVATFLIGLMPTTSQIGISAAVILVVAIGVHHRDVDTTLTELNVLFGIEFH